VTPVLERTDLSLAASAFPNPITGGNLVNLVVEVENLGPSNSTGFTLEVTLSDTLTFESSPDNCSIDSSGAVCGFSGSFAVSTSMEFRLLLGFQDVMTEETSLSLRLFPDDVDPAPGNDSADLTLIFDTPFFFGGFEDGTADEWSRVFP
ncbi:MAG: hypothetical protein AAF725_23195, partial [Acidobacteriota bacterium]